MLLVEEHPRFHHVPSIIPIRWQLTKHMKNDGEFEEENGNDSTVELSGGKSSLVDIGKQIFAIPGSVILNGGETSINAISFSSVLLSYLGWETTEEA